MIELDGWRRESLLASRPGTYTIRWMSYRAGLEYARHHHETSSVFVVMHGRVCDHAGPESLDAPEGGVGLIPSGVEHGTRFIADARTLAIDLHAPWLTETIEQRGASRGPSYRVRAEAMAIALKVLGAARRDEFATGLAMDELVLRLVDVVTGAGCEPARRASPWLAHVADYLRNAPGSPSLEDVAASVGRHPAHVCREFGAWAGCSMSRYVQMSRVERAAALLRESRRPLAQVALQAGFFDQAHLTRAFKNATGCTPARFVRRLDASPDASQH